MICGKPMAIRDSSRAFDRHMDTHSGAQQLSVAAVTIYVSHIGSSSSNGRGVTFVNGRVEHSGGGVKTVEIWTGRLGVK